MDNTDKKQPMTDEELSKISGGGVQECTRKSGRCPYCGMPLQPVLDDGHPDRCFMNPNNPNYIGG